MRKIISLVLIALASTSYVFAETFSFVEVKGIAVVTEKTLAIGHTKMDFAHLPSNGLLSMSFIGKPAEALFRGIEAEIIIEDERRSDDKIVHILTKKTSTITCKEFHEQSTKIEYQCQLDINPNK